MADHHLNVQIGKWLAATATGWPAIAALVLIVVLVLGFAYLAGAAL